MYEGNGAETSKADKMTHKSMTLKRAKMMRKHREHLDGRKSCAACWSTGWPKPTMRRPRWRS